MKNNTTFREIFVTLFIIVPLAILFLTYNKILRRKGYRKKQDNFLVALHEMLKGE